MKTCTRCGIEKPLSEYRQRLSRHGTPSRSARCKDCVREVDRTRAKTDHHKATRRAWYHRDPRKVMLLNARQTAEKRGVPFALTVDDIQIPAICPVLGIRLAVGNTLRGDTSPSIDRIRPREGYVPLNIRVISWRANRIKCDATIEELEAILKYMRCEALISG